MQGLQVELIDGLRRDELHSGTLDRLGDGLGITKVILLSLRIGPHILRRHQPGIVTKRLQLATEMMRNTMPPRSSKPTTWNEFLPISIPITVIVLLRLWDIGVLLVFGAPCQIRGWRGRSTAGPSH